MNEQRASVTCLPWVVFIGNYFFWSLLFGYLASLSHFLIFSTRIYALFLFCFALILQIVHFLPFWFSLTPRPSDNSLQEDMLSASVHTCCPDAFTFLDSFYGQLYSLSFSSSSFCASAFCFLTLLEINKQVA